MNAPAREQLKSIDGRVRFDEPLSKHTTFKVGGPADAFVEPASVAALVQAMRVCRDFALPITVLGEGSNLLVSDRGVRGVVVRLRGEAFEFIRLKRGVQSTHELEAGAGVKLFHLLKFARDERVSGVEQLAGIPGTVGGAVRMNAGTYLGELKDTCTLVRTASTRSRSLRAYLPEQLHFGYRSALIKPGEIVVAASFRVRTADDALYANIDALLERRKQTQPLQLPNAGSFFRNPDGDKAGRLIEAAGLKGTSIGGAEVSWMHANFLVNAGGATASDLRALGEHVQAVVEDRFGVTLVWEVKLMGEWS